MTSRGDALEMILVPLRLRSRRACPASGWAVRASAASDATVICPMCERIVPARLGAGQASAARVITGHPV